MTDRTLTDRLTGCPEAADPMGRGRLRRLIPTASTLALALVLTATGAPPVLAQEPPPPRPDLPQTAAQGPAATGRDASLKLDEAPPLHDLAGPYLAARQATADADFAAAARYYTRALAQDRDNALIADSLLYSLIAAGDPETALAEAVALESRGDGTDMARLVIRAGLARAEDWPGLLEALGSKPKDNAGGVLLLDGMMRAWALLGEGKAGDAITQFEALSSTRGARAMVTYNLGLAKAMVGDFEGALALIGKDGVGQHFLGTLAKAEILAQLDRRDEAIAVLDAQPGGGDEPAVIRLRAALESGQPVPFTAMTNARQGIAQLFLTFASVLGASVDPDPLSLVHARFAVWVDPELGEARLVLAEILQDAGQFDMAEEQYDALAALGDIRPVAEISRIDTLSRAGRNPQALEVATALTDRFPDLASGWVAQGDILRQLERFADAAGAYSRAIDLMQGNDALWFALYARGMSHERAGRFDLAEADLRQALDLSPDHPQILNYLGYSLIDRGEKLDEALAMIEKAVQLQPDGYILDSLAWGYFRIGRYGEAVAPMEQAAALMASDPLINDHLGDIYWKAGRHREAEIQWRRALSLVTPQTRSSEDIDTDRIRAKLARGLDAVLEDEAAGRPLTPPEPDPAPAPDDEAGSGD